MPANANWPRDSSPATPVTSTIDRPTRVKPMIAISTEAVSLLTTKARTAATAKPDPGDDPAEVAQQPDPLVGGGQRAAHRSGPSRRPRRRGARGRGWRSSATRMTATRASLDEAAAGRPDSRICSHHPDAQRGAERDRDRTRTGR